MKAIQKHSNLKFVFAFLAVGFLQLCYSEKIVRKIDIETYCTNVRQDFVCTGLDFGSPDIELQLETKERLFFNYVIFVDSNLTTIPHDFFQAFSLGHHLRFENCKLKSLHKWNFKDGEPVSTLSLNSNEIQKLPSEVFAEMVDMYELNLGNNLLNEFESDCFKGLPRLSKIVLSRNNISHIPTDLFSQLTELTQLDLDDNRIAVIAADAFHSNPQLAYINFGKNKIKFFSQSIVRNLDKPFELDLSNNPIEQLIILNADQLILSNTNITTLHLNNHLYGVRARHSAITEIVFTNVMNLQKVDLSYNHIANITNITRNGGDIWFLDLSHNPIGHINVKSFSKLTHLRELYLSHTNLLGLDFGSFSYHLSELNILDLSYNNFQHFDLEILSHQRQLETLYVDGNQLSDFNYAKLNKYFNKLNVIGLSDNNWNCSFLKSMVTHLHRKAIEIRIDDIIDHSIKCNTIGGVQCFDDVAMNVETTTTPELRLNIV